jgi:hypothetical protein
VLDADEGRTDFVRAAVMAEIERREKRQRPALRVCQDGAVS